MPGVLADGAPEAAVSAYRFSPRLCRPAGLMKLASWMLPTWVGVWRTRLHHGHGAIAADGDAQGIGREW